MLQLLVSLLVLVPLLSFWAWMFRDMTLNYRLPPGLRYYWLIAFVFLNVLAAGYYYFTEYRNRN